LRVREAAIRVRDRGIHRDRADRGVVPAVGRQRLQTNDETTIGDLHQRFGGDRKIATARPADAAALSRVSGVGETKLARYGPSVLALVAGETPPDA
jgi:superfamily II DNA helicase RecQ